MNEMATHTKNEKRDGRLPWTSMKMNHVGQVSQIVQGGGGKLSPPANDPGEPRKPKGGEP